MLHLHRSNQLPVGSKVVDDVEAWMVRVRLQDTPLTRVLLKEIEGAEWVSPDKFKDRFGCTLYIDALSTGCKTALLVAALPEYIIDTRECGHNARNAIIRNITTGNIIFHYGDFNILEGASDVIDVMLDGRHFTSLNAFNLYLEEV